METGLGLLMRDGAVHVARGCSTMAPGPDSQATVATNTIGPMIEVISQHAPNLDIVTTILELERSQYSESYGVIDYVPKVRALMKHLGIDRPAVWAVLAREREQKLPNFTKGKEWEWLLGIDQGRIAGYVDADLWNAFLRGKEIPLDQIGMRSVNQLDGMTILLPQPISQTEVIEIRRIERKGSGASTIVERSTYPPQFIGVSTRAKVG